MTQATFLGKVGICGGKTLFLAAVSALLKQEGFEVVEAVHDPSCLARLVQEEDTLIALIDQASLGAHESTRFCEVAREGGAKAVLLTSEGLEREDSVRACPGMRVVSRTDPPDDLIRAIQACAGEA